MGFLDGLLKPNIEQLQKKRNLKGLIKAMQHSDVEIQAAAAEAIGILARDTFDKTDDNALAVASAQLYGTNDTAARALDLLKELHRLPGLLDAATPLLELVLSPESRVRKAAVFALSRVSLALETPSLIPSMINVMIEIAKSEDDPAVIHEIEKGLPFLAYAAALGLLEGDGEMRLDLSDALLTIPNTAVEPLVKSLSNPKSSAYAAVTLIKIGEPAIPAILAVLNTKGGAMAAATLSRMGEPAVPGLVTALSHENPVVRGWAAEALGDSKQTKALEGLKEAMQKESHEDVKAKIEAAIDKIDSNA